MAYIDPDGMFGGERMGMLSDSAKMAWPWFWCASNTVGRVELNYREFSKTAFRQFKKPPTEQQFWDWVAEFHESFLMFVYESDGQVWGQWAVSEKYLPTYKTVTDKKSPAPMSDAFLAWHKKYQELKLSLISGKCRILNISKDFQNCVENSEKFHMGGERRGEIEERKEVKPSSPTDVGAPPPPTLFPVEAKYGKAWFDISFDRWYQPHWNKTGKSQARKAYEKRINILVRSGQTHEEAEQFLRVQLLQYRQRFEFAESWSWRVNMHPATWLNNEIWEDQGVDARASPAGYKRPELFDPVKAGIIEPGTARR